MEKLINPYDKEHMKMAMLKHEETFREQVYELHRLYQKQKLLMKNMSSGQLKQAKNTTTLKNHQLVNDHFDSNNNKTPRHQGYNVKTEVVDDETDLELTLGLSSYNVRRRKTVSDSASSSTGSTTPRGDLNKWGIDNLPHVKNPSFQLGGRQTTNPNVEDQFRQESMNNPPWLFQVLSLNMT